MPPKSINASVTQRENSTQEFNDLGLSYILRTSVAILPRVERRKKKKKEEVTWAITAGFKRIYLYITQNKSSASVIMRVRENSSVKLRWKIRSSSSSLQLSLSLSPRQTQLCKFRSGTQSSASHGREEFSPPRERRRRGRRSYIYTVL